MKKTPLFDAHNELGARIIDFTGWQMPVFYKSVLTEHQAVRGGCGIFDVSHMGEIRVHGSGARQFLQHALMNNIDKIVPGKGQYSAILNDAGGFIDDLILYEVAADDFLLCVNASNAEKDFEWLNAFERKNCTLENQSEQFGQIAVQGPISTEILKAALNENDASDLNSLSYMHITSLSSFQNTFLARSGYTGEKGYEIYCPIDQTATIWKKLIANGAVPVGLGARDTLRLEACYCLYGNDIDERTDPFEAGLKWALKDLELGFVGSDALRSKRPPKRQLRSFKMLEKAIPRSGMEILANDQRVGQVTSGSVLPTVGGEGGLAMLDSSIKPGDKVFIDVRGKQKPAEVCSGPLYKPRTH